MSAVGMQYAIEKHTILDINVDLKSSYIVVPHSGLYDKDKEQNLLVVNLGHFSMVSMNQDRSSITSVKNLYDKGLSDDEIVEFMVSKSYDKFMLRLTDIQILIVLEGEDWEGTLATPQRCAMHFLEPTSLEVILLKCLVCDDPRLPKVKMEAVLPAVIINIEDDRVFHLMSLIFSITEFGVEIEKTVETQQKLDTMSVTSSMTSDLNRLMSEKSLQHRRQHQSKQKTESEKKCEDIVQAIDFQMDFIMKDLNVALFKKSPQEEKESDLLLDFKVLRVVFKLVARTFDLTMNINVGSVELNFCDVDQQIGMLSTPMTEGEDKYMFLLKFVQVSKKSPEFHSLHGSVVQLVEMDVTSMTVLLHQEALLALWECARSIMENVSSLQAPQIPSKDGSQLPTSTSSRKITLPAIREEGPSSVVAPVRQAIDLKILLKIFAFRVELLNSQQSHAQFALDGSSVDVIVKKSYTEVLIKLRNFSLYDPNPLTKHHEIVTVMGEEALSIQVVMFNAEMMDADSVDIAVSLKTSAIRIFFLNWFVTRIMNFIHPFQTVQRMLEEAAKEAAESALQNVQDAYAKATRVSLNIDLQAPVIVIPANSTSTDALYFDMGTLTVKNRFETSTTTNDSGQNAVIDEITVGLQAMKLLRVKLSPEEEVLSECVLLKPITCKVLVRRNLSAGWYTTAPDIDCSGRLETVLLSLSEDDYQMLLRIPNENMQEKEDPPLTPVMELNRPVSQDTCEIRIERPKTLQSLPITGPVTTTVKFTFTMDKLVVDLFSGGSELEYKTADLSKHEEGLGRFSLNFLSLKGHVFSDGTLSTSLLLVDCLLDDTRSGTKSKITRLMQRKTDAPQDVIQTETQEVAEESFKSMLDVTYQQKGEDSFVDVRIFGFDLVLSTEYLMKVGDFFAGWTYQARMKEIAEDYKSEIVPATTKSSRTTTRTTASNKTVTIAGSCTHNIVPEKKGKMTLNVRVEKPDIIMVESVSDINTKAIVLNKELTLKMRLSDQHQVICGSIKDLELYSCVFNPKRRAETTYQILRPCCISIAGSTPGGEGLHLDICLTPVRLSVSPAIIELLTNVQKGLVLPEPQKIQKTEERTDYSDMWQPKPFSEEQYWYFKTDEAEEASESIFLEEPLKPTVQGELCIVSVSSIVITVEAGVGNQTLPMILIDMSFNGAINNWSSRLFIDSCMSLEIKYYNSALALWEPLLEPVEVQQENGIVAHVPWELRLQMHMNPLEAPPVMSPTSESEVEVEELHVQPPLMAIEISSKENLELTISKTCLDVLVNLGKSFQTALAGSLIRAEAVAPFTIKNDTGLAIAVIIENSPFKVLSRYTVSVVPFVWKNLQNLLTTSKVLQCDPKSQTDGKQPFMMKIPEYLEKEWSCDHELEANSAEYAVWTFGAFDSQQRVSLDLGMRTIQQLGSTVMTLYCPYWMLNKTGLLLTYRKSRKPGHESSGSPLKQIDDSANVLYHPEHFKGPIMFSFKAKSFFGKKKASIKVEDSEWSDKFPLDVAGSSGLVHCKHADLVYKIGVYIQLTYSSLTKQVIFTPYYVLLNSASFSIEVQEAERPADPWIIVEPNGCSPFWPRSSNTKHLRARVAGSSEMTASFSYDTVYTTLLRLDNKYGGLNVDVQMAEGSVYISFMAYEPGLAPALIMNNLDVPVSYHEEDDSTPKFLEPKNGVMFTWTNPLGTKTLIWANHKKKQISDDLRKSVLHKRSKTFIQSITEERNVSSSESQRDDDKYDGGDDGGSGDAGDCVINDDDCEGVNIKTIKSKLEKPWEKKKSLTEKAPLDGIGEFAPAVDKRAYWVSFLDGMQRILLFTYDLNVARDAQSAGEMERIDQEITLAIHGVGLSLVNNYSGLENLYCCLASSGVIWEMCKLNQKRFKPLNVMDTRLVEEAYVRYQQDLVLGEIPTVQTLENGMEVDFEKGELIKPHRRRLKRTYNTGLWLQMKTSKHQMQLHAKVNRLQVDNQMPDCIFPVVVAPVPLPRSISANSAFKPFLELSIVKRLMEHSPVVQYKYFKALVQEFHIKVDIGFINALLQFIEADVSDEDEQMRFEEDCKVMNEPLKAHASLMSSAEQKNFYDLLHFSPLKLHWRWVERSRSGGTTFPECSDAELAYFERNYTFLTQRQLTSEVSTHYIGQLLKQLYGAIQGPGEFAEGLVLGVRSLLGHTVGGAAGAMSRIAGAMGKGVAALTFDKDYQRKRREQFAQRPANLHTGLAQSGKGLVMGVVAGVSGVFTKPVSGAREEGVEGFFKGMGKGMVGLGC
ncbi:Vacuolar protein sorting-associated protein 13A-like Protein [Gryllus bimaculatus]|nr:Vacuolar protein sorting-associated protein 13A-like Protein [Gryllus bimaculatus]